MSAGISECLRPDGRLLVRAIGAWTSGGAGEAVAAADRRGASAVTHVDGRDARARRVLESAGFTLSRRDAQVSFSVERALEALARSGLPAGVSARSADEVEENALRILDDELRQDVPGTAGWRSSREEFREHTFADPAFDPRTYLVAVDDRSGELLGLARIWMNPEGPRLGKLGVRHEHRRRGIGSGLLARTLEAVSRLGATEVTTEHDLTNEAVRELVERCGARRIRTVLELVYEPRGSRRRPTPLTEVPRVR